VRKKIPLLLLSSAVFSALSWAGTEPASTEPVGSKPSAPVKYKAAKDVNFEELLIQGQLQRPEITVVTGESAQGTDGMLRLRENFLDQIAVSSGEEVQ
jgi:hypothetical protein